MKVLPAVCSSVPQITHVSSAFSTQNLLWHIWCVLQRLGFREAFLLSQQLSVSTKPSFPRTPASSCLIVSFRCYDLVFFLFFAIVCFPGNGPGFKHTRYVSYVGVLVYILCVWSHFPVANAAVTVQLIESVLPEALHTSRLFILTCAVSFVSGLEFRLQGGQRSGENILLPFAFCSF